MLKPKSQIFKLKFHLAKVQAVNNKVNSRVHAYLHIDNEQLEFKGAPQLKKNVAIFGSDLEYDNFMISYDEITGLYEQKKVLLVIEFETQGAYIKIGEVSVNVGEILNEKKYRVVNVYPLSKCYDKSAKVKLAVDFIPVSEKRESSGQHVMSQNMMSQNMMSQNMMSNINNIPTKTQVSFKQSSTVRKQELVGSNAGSLGGGLYKNPTGVIKSRLAEEENVILQQKIYEYEKRMDNYRIAQNQLSERMQEQLQRKDDKISELSLQLTKQQNTIHLISLENESLKTQIKQLHDQNQLLKLQIKSHLQNLDHLQKLINAKDKQLEAKTVSLENLSRTKENKQKHLTQEIHKYTARYSQSEQERNKIIFELENKLKLELDKKDQHYQELINVNEAKFLETIKAVKERNRYLEQEYKNMEELLEQHDTKIKALSLELQKSTTLAQQQEQEMVYLNQELNKARKQKQTQSNELDSLNFSYQETVAQLQTHKQQIKQLSKKIQLLKTQLSLSNQTIDEQRERIIVMNKDLQVHQEREYYMKEHYEEEIYDREVAEDQLRTAREQLQGLNKKLKEQLKLAEEKADEEQSKNDSLKSTIESLEKELLNKNSHLMKLGEDKLYLQTELKNAKTLIAQLQQELTKLEQEKAYLSEAFMEKKIALENDKSLEWSYKIQSLQNDIQLMVDKFKAEKQSLKENFKKEEAKRVDEINKLTLSNKKLKQDVDDIRDKLSKRQNYLVTVQKSLKSEKEKSHDYERQLASLKQTYRLLINQKQSLEHSQKELTRQRELRQKQLDQTQKRSQKYKKQLSQIKNGFHKLITIILEYMVKRYNERTNFQDISLDILVDGQIVSYVNVALKKFSEDHNKTREMIKELQEFKRSTLLAHDRQGPQRRSANHNGVESQGPEQYQEEYEARQNNRKGTNYQFEQEQIKQMYTNNKINANNNSKRSYQVRGSNYNGNMSNSLQLQSPFNIDPVKQLENYRQEVDRLKKQQSEYKVKIKSLEEQIQKQERNVENGKFELNRVKTELEEAQDEVTRVNFVVRKKDKVIKELQMEVQQLQKQTYDLRANTSSQSLLEKAKQKMSNSSHQPLLQNPSLPIIRDLESKLNLKSEELGHVQREVQSLREQYLQELNEVKKLQAKLKEKSARIVSLEKELDTQQMKRTDDKDKEIMRLRKVLDEETQNREKIEDKLRVLENTVKQYEQEVCHLEGRNKELMEQMKLTEVQFRRNLQSNEYLLNDKSTVYETQILQLKSQLAQQSAKSSDLAHKNSQLNLALGKKSQQLEQLKEKLVLTDKERLRLEELNEEEKNRMILKINALNDRIRELQTLVEGKSFELEECKFAYEGRVLELERQMDEFRDGLVRAGPGSPR